MLRWGSVHRGGAEAHCSFDGGWSEAGKENGYYYDRLPPTDDLSKIDHPLEEDDHSSEEDDLGPNRRSSVGGRLDLARGEFCKSWIWISCSVLQGVFVPVPLLPDFSQEVVLDLLQDIISHT